MMFPGSTYSDCASRGRRAACVATAGLLAALATIPACSRATPEQTTTPEASAPPLRARDDGRDINFGFPLGFSAEKMDSAADPRKDFARYAVGRWIDAAVIPGDTVRVSSMDLLTRQVERQIDAILDEAAQGSAAAAKGSPLQQVGDYYASGMDETRLAALGVTPISAEMEAIRVDSPAAVAATLAHLSQLLNEPVVAAITVGSDPSDRTRYAVYLVDAALGMAQDNYLRADAAPLRAAYTDMIAAKLAIAGRSQADAARIAAQVLDIETRVARKKLTPLQERDPNQRFVRMSFAKAQALAPAIDLTALFQAGGLPVQADVIVMNAAALGERSAILEARPKSDVRDYLQWELLRHAGPFLTPALVEPSMAFARAMYGNIDTPPRTKLIAADTTARMGHPLSQLYVARHFPAASRTAAEALIGEIRSTFRARLAANTWLSAETRQQALDKLDKMVIRVGYPDTWIDYADVQIRRDDYVGNVFRLNQAAVRRDFARFGKPVTEDQFAQPGSTLPVNINAGYAAGRNGIEIPAAFLQPPFYDASADPAVNYCALGAVIGHEITHGFDSSGRLYDAGGNVRNWWTEADGRAFVARAQTLVDQGNAFEILPGLTVNGALAVGENLADAGGVSLAYEALQAHLAAHPAAVRTIDGLSPQQRCFVTWAQAWADKAQEGWLRQSTATDPHPPGPYRLLAPLQHEPGFFKAFGIVAGDRMWRAEKDRVAIW